MTNASANREMSRARGAGFTIIELMITVLLLSILMMVAAPSVRDLNMNARMTSAANDLMTDLAMARSESVKRGVRTVLCTSSSGSACTSTAWEQGWLVFVDPNSDGALAAATDILKASPAIEGGIGIVSAPATNLVQYRPSGTSGSTTALVNTTFTLCDSRTTASVNTAAIEKGRLLTVSATGRAGVVRHTCP